MALANGVLVHGPTSWACAVRTDDGSLKVVAERKRLIGSRITQPLLRGPARLVESFAVLPRLKRALPEARLPFEGGTMVASTAAAAVALHGVRRSRLSATSRGLVGGLIAIAPACSRFAAARSPATTGPSTSRSAATNTTARPARSTSAAGATWSARSSRRRRSGTCSPRVRPPRSARPPGSWSRRRDRRLDRALRLDAGNPDRPLARALARPGHELPAPPLDGRAEPCSARGRRGRARGLPEPSAPNRFSDGCPLPMRQQWDSRRASRRPCTASL